ncbi:GNAT family N-acetyltransferase [Natronococcus jeotgali]|uniref:Protein N-acetyltransferase-like protein n=1 Tax=Natronococcus jeotgali DSM 18795 TaxID=1227498 RepID=L9XTE2_9EURY|nr:hypothetical protein [Natronococcus jeotgali]ELY65049.1 protein N-acetyltransferase-like protein [Natronococcus jeotgali DSM 18795]
MPGARIRRGERVTLRTLEDEDRPFLQRAYANPEIRYPLGTPLKRRGDLERWLDDDADRLLICLDEGRIRKDRFVDGAYRDTIQYGLLLEEWCDDRDQ